MWIYIHAHIFTIAVLNIQSQNFSFDCTQINDLESHFSLLPVKLLKVRLLLMTFRTITLIFCRTSNAAAAAHRESKTQRSPSCFSLDQTQLFTLCGHKATRERVGSWLLWQLPAGGSPSYGERSHWPGGHLAAAANRLHCPTPTAGMEIAEAAKWWNVWAMQTCCPPPLSW